MTAISAECCEAKDTNQMEGGTRHFPPCGHEEVPNIPRHRRGRTRMFRRLFQEHREPSRESSPVSLEQRSPADHINSHAVAEEEFLDGRIPHKPVWLSKIRQHADRSSRRPAQEPSNQKRQNISIFRRSDPPVVISVGFQAIGEAAMGADRRGHHLRMTAASDVRFRVTSELENDLHRIFVYQKGFKMQLLGCIRMTKQDGPNFQSPGR